MALLVMTTCIVAIAFWFATADRTRTVDAPQPPAATELAVSSKSPPIAEHPSEVVEAAPIPEIPVATPAAGSDREIESEPAGRPPADLPSREIDGAVQATLPQATQELRHVTSDALAMPAPRQELQLEQQAPVAPTGVPELGYEEPAKP